MKTAYLEHKKKSQLIHLLSIEIARIGYEKSIVSSTHFYDEISESYKSVIFYYD